MAEEKQTLVLDLDTKDFVKGILSAQSSIQGLGAEDNIKGLISGLTTATSAIAILGTAAFAMKAAFDMTMEAESIQKIHHQFELLTEQAGIATDVLSEGLERAAAGLVDDEELLKAANKALVSLSEEAARFPELMELARKSTAVFGGEITDTFETMARAVSSGNTRMLKQMGIVVDADKAVRDYAVSVGKMTFELTEAEKKHALMNEVLRKGSAQLGAAGDVADTATTAWKRLKVSVGEFWDTINLTVGTKLAPLFKSVFSGATLYLEEFTGALKGNFGTATEKAAYQVDKLQSKIDEHSAALQRGVELHEQYKDRSDRAFQDKEVSKGIEYNTRKLEEYGYQMAEAKIKLEELQGAQAKPEEGSAKKVSADDEGALSKKEAETAKFYQSLEQMRQQDLNAQMNLATQEEDIEFLTSQKILSINKELALKEQELRANAKAQNISDHDLNVQLAAARSQAAVEEANVFEQENQKKIQAIDNFIKKSNNGFANFIAGAKKSSLSATKDISAMAKAGEAAMGILASAAGSAFMALGAGAAKGSIDAKKVMLTMIADIAQAFGSLFLAQGVGTYNPAVIAAGASLLALSGFLRAIAGGGGSSIPASSGGESAAGGGTALASAEERPQLQEEKKQRSVSVNIMGHYFETPETRRVLTDLIRQEADATQFTINQVGQGA